MNRAERRFLTRRIGGKDVSPAVELLAKEDPAVLKPLMDAFDILALECESEHAEDFVMAHELTAREILQSEKFKAKMIELVEAQTFGLLRSPAFQKTVERLLNEHIQEVAVDILAERIPEAEERIRALVLKEWDERVAKVAHDLLEQKLQALKQGFVR